MNGFWSEGGGWGWGVITENGDTNTIPGIDSKALESSEGVEHQVLRKPAQHRSRRAREIATGSLK